MSTLPAPPAVPAAAEPTPAGAPKKAVAKPATSVPPAKAAAKAALTKPALKAPAASTSKPLAKAFAPAKPAVKPAKAAQKAAPPEKPAKAPKPTATPSAKPGKPAKPPKVKKPKLVRDRFTATEDDMAVPGAQAACRQAGHARQERHRAAGRCPRLDRFERYRAGGAAETGPRAQVAARIDAPPALAKGRALGCWRVRAIRVSAP